MLQMFQMLQNVAKMLQNVEFFFTCVVSTLHYFQNITFIEFIYRLIG